MAATMPYHEILLVFSPEFSSPYFNMTLALGRASAQVEKRNSRDVD